MRATQPARLFGFRHSRSLFPAIFRTSLALVLLGSCAAVRAADWPPLVPAELAMKDNPAEPGSDAMILYREQVADATRSFETFYYRIKIFNAAGKKHADVEIPFVKGFEDIRDVHGRTVHPDGQSLEFDGKVLEKLVVKAGSIKVLTKSITMPDVTAGSIIEYRYKIQLDPNRLYNTTWNVQEGLYTQHAHFVYLPYRESNAGMFWRSLRLPPGMSPQKQKDGSYLLDANDLPGVPEEEYMLPVADIRGVMEFIYAVDTPTKNPQDYWNTVAKRWYGENSDFIGKHSEIKQAADQAVAPGDSPEEKLRKLYLRAQQVKNYQLDEDKTAQEAKRDNQKENKNVADVLKHGYGSGMDINRLFIALAQAEGFDAETVWSASRTDSAFHMELEDPKELNNEFVWVHTEAKDYFADPAVPWCPFGVVPWYDTAITVMRLTKQGAVFVSVPANPTSQASVTRHADLAIDDDGKVTGTFRATFIGDRALGWRQDARNKDDAARKKMMLDELKQWFPVDTKIEITAINNWDKGDQPLEVVSTIETTGLLQSAGRRVLLPVDIYTSGRPQIFEHENRKQSVYFAYPYEETDEIRMRLPLTWKIESLPKPQTVDPGGKIHYELAATQDGGYMNIKRTISVGGIIYPVNQYSALRHFFGTVKANDEQQAIFQTGSGSGKN
jgi:Domain of Unknown Function with PDB structure (DUF3857)/Transglutaminase-like superfamily